MCKFNNFHRWTGSAAAIGLVFLTLAPDAMGRGFRGGGGRGFHASFSRSSLHRSGGGFGGFSHGFGSVSHSSHSNFSIGRTQSHLSAVHLDAGLGARTGLGTGLAGGLGAAPLRDSRPAGIRTPEVGRRGPGLERPDRPGRPGRPGPGLDHRPGPHYPPGSWRGHYHYPHNNWISHRWNYWGDYWRWRALAGAIRLGAYYLTYPPYYTQIYFDGIYYYYADGVYYRRVGGVYEVVAAPYGVVVPAAPPTYETVPVQTSAPDDSAGGGTTTVNNNYYYYANGTFYQETGAPPSNPTAAQAQSEQAAAQSASTSVTSAQKQGTQTYQQAPDGSGAPESGTPRKLGQDPDPGTNYQVAAPPRGASVSVLPADAKEQKIGDTNYYTYAGTWYQAFYSGSKVVYMVVAKPSA